METLSMNGTVGWKRLPPKSESFIARNKTFVKDISRKQRLSKTTAKPTQQQRKTSRPSAAAAQPRQPAKEAPLLLPGVQDSVIVSKTYLEELLSFKARHHSVGFPTRAEPTAAADPSSHSRVEADSTRENPHAARDPRATSLGVVVEYDENEIPGLGRHEDTHNSLAVKQIDRGGGARASGGGPWQSTPLKVQERKVGHRSRRGHLRQEPEGEEYFPWGRPGGGAPLFSNSGRRSCTYTHSNRTEGLRPMKETAPSHDWSHDRSHDSNKLIPSPPRPAPAAMRCSISMMGVGDDVSEKERKQAKQKQWLQELCDQIQSKRSSLSPPPSRHVGGKGSPRPTDAPGNVGLSPISPREGSFGRGAGPHVDQFVLREKDERRKREMENRDYLQSQVEEKQRQKEEDMRRREDEARREDERVASEQARLQAEYQREQEKAAQKEEEAVRRHALLQQRIFEAEQAAAEAKQKRKLQQVSPQKSGDVCLAMRGLAHGSAINLVIDKERTPPTSETRVLPISTSVDQAESTGHLTHSSPRSPSLLMYGSLTSTKVKRTEGDTTGGGGGLSQATGAKLTSKSERATVQQPGGHKQSEAQGRVRTQQPGGHKQSVPQERVRTQQPGGHKQSEAHGRVRTQQPGGHKQSEAQGRVRTQQPGGHKQSEAQGRVRTQQPGGHKQSEAQGRVRTQQPGGHRVKRDRDSIGPKTTISVPEPRAPLALQPRPSPQADSPPMPALTKKVNALPAPAPALPPAIPPPLLESHTEHQPLGLDEEGGVAQFRLPELAKERCVLTGGAEADGGQDQVAAGGTVLSTLANLKQTLLSAEQKLQLHFLIS